MNAKKEAEGLLNDTFNAVPSRLVAKYATVLTLAVLLVSYGLGQLFYTTINNTFIQHDVRISRNEAYDLCNELRLAAGSDVVCGIIR